MKKLLLTGLLIACTIIAHPGYAQGSNDNSYYRTGLKIDDNSTTPQLVDYELTTYQYSHLNKMVHGGTTLTVPVQTQFGGNEEAVISYDPTDQRILVKYFADKVNYVTFYIKSGGYGGISMSQPSKVTYKNAPYLMGRILNYIHWG